jgi:hypothetical protein
MHDLAPLLSSRRGLFLWLGAFCYRMPDFRARFGGRPVSSSHKLFRDDALISDCVLFSGVGYAEF